MKSTMGMDGVEAEVAILVATHVLAWVFYSGQAA
jgi:hypothetical protein